MPRTLRGLTWPTKRGHVAHANVQRKDKKYNHHIFNVLR